MKKVLFVCTANVCRSPMAEAIFNALAEDKGLPWRAESAGVGAIEGFPPTENALAALEEAGVPAREEHRSRPVEGAALEAAELVLTMTERQAQQLRARFPEFADKIHTLASYTGNPAGNVSDPIGGSMTSYRATMRLLFRLVDRAMEKLNHGEER